MLIANRLLVLVLLFVALLPAQEGRRVVNATWAGEKVTVAYGTPDWNPGFLEQIRPGLVWRLGRNDPTRITTRCALLTDEGVVAPGEYGLAMRAEKGGGWSLLIYDGKGQFSESFPKKAIGARPSIRTDVNERLEIALGEEGALHVTFGPLRADFAITPLPVTRFDTRFASFDTEVQVANMPLAGKMPREMAVGNAVVTIPQRMMERMVGEGAEGMEVRYGLKLDMAGDTPRLAFTNGRKDEIPGEKKALEARIGRIQAFVKRNPAAEERGAAAIADVKERMASLDREAQLLERFTPNVVVEGKSADRETATAALSMATERPQGLLVLIFGAGDRDARFEVDPQNFLKRRRDR